MSVPTQENYANLLSVYETNFKRGNFFIGDPNTLHLVNRLRSIKGFSSLFHCFVCLFVEIYKDETFFARNFHAFFCI